MKISSLSAFPGDVDRARGGGAFGAAERDAAADLVRAVRRGGDAAVLRTVRRFDNARARPEDLIVEAAVLRRAARACPLEVRRALELAYARIRVFHERQRPREATRRGSTGELRLVPTPLERVGALVPRGKSSYPSTVLMTGVPAQVAGVRALAVASPMPQDGSIDPALAYAMQLVGARMLYRAGGAAGVAALAYGTRSLHRVDKIVGPGNAYTAAAKWLVSADVGIDALQGPSELVAVASSDADVNALALDLLAQAEHGAGAFAALISDDAGWLRAVAEAIGRTGAARVRAYRARNLGAAVRAVNDDVAGTNHALPTGGTARWASALRVDDFVRWTSRVSLRGDLRNLVRAGAAIADHEGMRYHKASIEARA